MKKRKMKMFAAVAAVTVLLSGCLGGGTTTQSPENNKKTAASEEKPENTPEGSGEKITMRLATSTQPSMPGCMAAQKFAEEVEKQSNGRITVKFFPSRQLGDEAELLQQLMGGTLESALISTSTFSNYTPLLDTLQLPFLLNTYDKEYQAVTSPEMQEIFQALEQFGIKPLSIYEYGMRHIANNTRPIETLEDLKGLKLRVVPSDLILESMKALGANPTPMAYGEVYTSLQTKVIDGEEINLTSIYSEKHYEVLNYISEIGLWPFPSVLAINLDFYNKLSEEDQALLKRVAAECLDYNIGLFEESEAQAVKTIEESGTALNQVEDIQPFKDATRDIYSTYTQKDPLIQKFVNMAEKIQSQK